MVLWSSAVAADDGEHAEFLWEVGTVLSAHCHHEGGPSQVFLQFSRLL